MKPPTPSESAGAAMSPGRQRAVAAGIGLFVAVSALHAATGREHWPFSPYTMYATPDAEPETRSEKLVLVAVDRDGNETWLLSRRDLAPLNRARVGAVLGRAQRADPHEDAGAGAGAGPRLRVAFRDLVGLIAPNHPDAAAFRLYRAVWEIRPDASNLRSPGVWERWAEEPAP